MTMRVLYVDADADSRRDASRALHADGDAWDASLAVDLNDAVRALQQQAFDAVVVEFGSLGADAARLLEMVRHRWPEVVRVGTSAGCGPDVALRAVGPCHQLMALPLDPPLLRQVIEWVRSLNERLDNERLRALLARIDSIPSLPALYAEIVTALQSPDASLRDIGRLIAKDPGMTAQILRLINSAHFGLMQEVSSPAMAVNYLGVMTVSSLVLTGHLFRTCEEGTLRRLQLADLWNHSLAAGTFAKLIAEEECLSSMQSDESFTAGLLHDAGKLVLAANASDAYVAVMREASASGRRLVEVEAEAFGASHGELGAHLLRVWGLPHAVVEAVAYHNEPSRCPNTRIGPLTTTHVASALAHAGPADRWPDVPAGLDLPYLMRVGGVDRLPAWKRVCRAASATEGAGV